MADDQFLGIDYGERRIGLAIGDLLTGVARVIGLLNVNSTEDSIQQIRAVCQERGVTHLVLGLPLRMNGTDSTVTTAARKFGESLQAAIGLPLIWVDERLTTAMAERVLIDSDMAQEKRKKVRDQMAAQILLQNYIDSKMTDLPVWEGDESELDR